MPGGFQTQRAALSIAKRGTADAGPEDRAYYFCELHLRAGRQLPRGLRIECEPGQANCHGQVPRASVRASRRGKLRHAWIDPLLEQQYLGQQLPTVGAVPLKRLAGPHDVANAVVWLASDQADYISSGMITVDAGATG